MEKVPFEELETERLYLRRHDVTFEHATKLYDKIKGDWDHIKVWLPKMWNVKAPEDEYAFFQASQTAWERNEKADYGLYEKTTNEMVGTLGFFDVSWTDAHAEIGYFLFSSHTKKGYISEAVAAMRDWAFKNGFHRLQIKMDTGNTASENVAKRAGFEKEGEIRDEYYSPHFQSYRSIYLYALLNQGKQNG